MTPNLLGLICLAAGCTIGWALRTAEVWRLQEQNAQLLDDLDDAVRDIAAMLGKQNHPAGRQLRIVKQAQR